MTPLNPTAMRIESAHFQDFAPFADGSISFPGKPEGSRLGEVHFLVGGNGAGKTRLLCLLAAALGNRESLQARVGPARLNAAVLGMADRQRGCWSDQKNFCGWIAAEAELPTLPLISEGRFNYSASSPTLTGDFSNGAKFAEPRFALAFHGMSRMNDEPVEALKAVALDKRGEQLLLQSPDPETRKAISQSLTNLKMRAAMDTMQTGGTVTRSMRMAAALENCITSITGRSFAITVTSYPKVNLCATWGGKLMQMNQLPDGLRAIIGWLAATVGKLDAAFPEHPDPLGLPIVLLVDEPEAHLHPSWQRQVLPAIQRLLPNAQIIAATHSPFVISSVNEGWIHILNAAADGSVRIEPPVPCEQGDSYLDVVEDVLGVKEWYDPETEGLLEQFRAVRGAVLGGQWQRENEVRELAGKIGGRGIALSDMMGREMSKLTKLKAHAAKP